MVSVPAVILLYERALNLSKASWAKVEASVILFPNELFLVVWTIKPAKANNDIDNITIAISTSISEKPLDILGGVNVLSPENDFDLMKCKTYTNEFRPMRGGQVNYNFV